MIEVLACKNVIPLNQILEYMRIQMLSMNALMNTPWKDHFQL